MTIAPPTAESRDRDADRGDDQQNELKQREIDAPLCLTCRFYEAHETEGQDLCLHPHSRQISSGGGVREHNAEKTRAFSCIAMRAGLCENGRLHVAKS